MNVNVAFSAPEIHAGILPLVCHTHTRTHTRAHAHGHTHRRACMRRVWSRRLCGIATAACVVPGRCVAKAGLTRGCAHQLRPAVLQQCWRTDRATRHWRVDHRHLNRHCRRRRREIASLACAARRGRFVRCARVRWHRTFNAKKERERPLCANLGLLRLRCQLLGDDGIDCRAINQQRVSPAKPRAQARQRAYGGDSMNRQRASETLGFAPGLVGDYLRKGRRPVSGLVYRSTTCGEEGSIVMITSAPVAASFAVVAAFPPENESAVRHGM